MLEPVNTVLKAVRRLSLLRGDVVLVAGQGPIGLMFTRLLQLAGAQVIATDLLEPRLKLARQFGARWTLNVTKSGAGVPPALANRPLPPGRLRYNKRFALNPQLSTLNHLATRGRGLDAAVIAVPSDAAVQQALQLVRGGGQVLLFAHTKRNSLAHPMGEGGRRPGEGSQNSGSTPRRGEAKRRRLNFPLDLASVCLDEKDLLGSYSSDFTLQDEVARQVFSRRLDVRQLISHRFPLEQTAAAVQLAGRPAEDSLKILVENDARNR